MLIEDRPLGIYLACAVMFHFANAATLPLLGEMLAKGAGRFIYNFTLRAIGTAVGIGVSLSQVIAGSIVHHFGWSAGFLFLAAVAAAALGILYFFMPETRGQRSLKPT